GILLFAGTNPVPGPPGRKEGWPGPVFPAWKEQVSRAGKVVSDSSVYSPSVIMELSPPRPPSDASNPHGDPDLGRADEVLAPPGRRPRSVRPVPALLQTARGAARLLLRARLPRRRRGADRLRPLQRLLRGPHREEAAVPLPAGHARALLRHRGLQPGLPLL